VPQAGPLSRLWGLHSPHAFGNAVPRDRLRAVPPFRSWYGFSDRHAGLGLWPSCPGCSRTPSLRTTASEPDRVCNPILLKGLKDP
jgi:hypothetical protein